MVHSTKNSCLESKRKDETYPYIGVAFIDKCFSFYNHTQDSTSCLTLLLLTLIYGLIRTLAYISSKHKMFSLKCKPAFWLDLMRVACFCNMGCVSDVFFSSPSIAHLGLTIKLTIKLNRELEFKGPTLYSFSNLNF